MNRNTRKSEDRRNLIWAAAGTVIAGLLTGVTIEAAHAQSAVAASAPRNGEPTWLPDGSAGSLAPSDGLPEAAVVATRAAPAARPSMQADDAPTAADLPETDDGWQGGPVITVIDLGDPAYGETVSFNLNLASDGHEHYCEFLFVNGKDEEIQVDHPAWRIHLAPGQERVDWKLEKTFHVTQFPPTAEGINRFSLLCDGRITDEVEFRLYAP